MTLDEPFFMKNMNWYYYDLNQKKYVLRKSAPEKAVASYNQFYNEVYKQYGKESGT